MIFINYLFRSLIIALIFVLLSACSQKKEEVIEMKDKEFSGMVMIQKMKNQKSSEEMTKVIKDKQKIEKVFNMVEGLKVKETDDESMEAEMKSHDSYSFLFAEGEEMESGKPVPYSIFVLNDGTFFFTHKNVNSSQKLRITIEKHKNLLNEMKHLLEVDF